ncbi:MAG: hypothetical protein OXD32_02570 [Endozoicomonadaceae bacterium]|nr:hypothetical protein [Endozoicomonadaceae bacterium]
MASMRHPRPRYLRKKGYIILTVLITTFLFGCRFHLRDNTMQNQQLKQLYVIASDTDFYTILQNSMQKAGIVIQPDAPWIVDIISVHIQENQEYLSSMSTNYFLSGSVKWTLKNAAGVSLFMPRIIEKSTSFLGSADNINAVYNQQELQKSQLKQELANSLLREISAINSKELQHLTHTVRQKKETDQSAGNTIKVK